jgi:beta-xylosidase
VKFLAVFFLLLSFLLAAQDKIINGSDFIDTDGNIINAHGGGFLKIDNDWYWFGEVRTGQQENTGKVSVYRSPDLYHWYYEGIALDMSVDPRKVAIERPKVIYNAESKKYVMWMHIELHGQYKTAMAGVAQSEKVTGPYNMLSISYNDQGVDPIFSDIHPSNNPVINKNVERANATFIRDKQRGQDFRDMTLFKDDDGKAYIVYSSEANLSLHISQLDSSYTHTNGNLSQVLVGQKNEAPAIFKKDKHYYLFTSGLKGFTPTDARSAISDDLLGRWEKLGNPVASEKENDKNTTYATQSTYIVSLPEKNKIIFMSDRWNKKNLKDSKYIWLPIAFVDGTPKIFWKDSWSF